MKVSIPVSILALIVATIALIRSYQAPEPVNQEQIELAVEDTLRKREKEFVDEFKPQFQAMFADMGGELDQSWEPQTIGELFEPLTKIITSMTGE